MTESYERLKQLATVRMAEILGSRRRAEMWMICRREEFDTAAGEWRNALETIEDGEYDKVSAEIDRIDYEIY